MEVIHRTPGVCRYIYNFYIAHNKEVYEKEKRFVRGMDFSKWLNNEYLPTHPEYQGSGKSEASRSGRPS